MEFDLLMWEDRFGLMMFGDLPTSAETPDDPKLPCHI